MANTNRIRLVTTTGRTDGLTEADMVARGYEVIGYNANTRQRAELQGAPKFRGLAGPMWDGDCLRYEDPKTYAELSS